MKALLFVLCLSACASSSLVEYEEPKVFITPKAQELWLSVADGISPPCKEVVAYYEVSFLDTREEVGSYCGKEQLSGCIRVDTKNIYVEREEESYGFGWYVLMHEYMHAALYCEGVTNHHRDIRMYNFLSSSFQKPEILSYYETWTDNNGTLLEYFAGRF